MRCLRDEAVQTRRDPDGSEFEQDTGRQQYAGKANVFECNGDCRPAQSLHANSL